MSGGDLAGVITAAAGLITALTTLVALLGHLMHHDPPAAKPSAPAKDGQGAGTP